MYTQINDFVKTIRLELGYSQTEFADFLNCSRDLISKIENNKRYPTDEFLYNLSELYKVDIIHYKNHFSKFKSIDDYILFYELRNCVENMMDDQLEEILKTNDRIQDFSYGEPFLLKNYCIALIQFLKYKDYKSTIEYCLKNLNCKENELMTSVPTILKTQSFYSAIILLIATLTTDNNLELAYSLNNAYVEHFNYIWSDPRYSHSQQNSIYKKIYLTLLNNQVHINLEKNDLTKALELCELAISKSHKLNIMNVLPTLLKMKIEIFCKLNQFENARYTHNQFKVICELTDSVDYFEKSTDTFQNTFSELFS